jgi:hypothetical protein
MCGHRSLVDSEITGLRSGEPARRQCHLLFAERTMATGFCFCSFRPGSAGVPPARHWYTDDSGINQIVVAAWLLANADY